MFLAIMIYHPPELYTSLLQPQNVTWPAWVYIRHPSFVFLWPQLCFHLKICFYFTTACQHFLSRLCVHMLQEKLHGSCALHWVRLGEKNGEMN